MTCPFSSHIVRRPNAEAPAQPLCAQRLNHLRSKDCLFVALIPRAGRAKVHVKEQCNIPRREVLAGTGEVVESPGGLSPPGAPRTVHDRLESHGSRCSAVAMA